MEELVSVIIPVYRVEKYIKKCVNSVCNQTYKNLEILLIDDGSDDGCPEICDILAGEDARIRVIHKENGGLSDARNAGIEAAKGEYLLFVDGDDYIAEWMVEGLHNMIETTDANLAVCDFSLVNENGEALFDGKEPQSVRILDKDGAIGQLFGVNPLQTIVAWNKLYRREVFEKLRYPFGKYHEDEFVIHRILEAAGKIAYTDSKWYDYVQRGSSIMGNSYSLKRLDGLEARYLRFLDFEKEGKRQFAREAYVQYLWSLQDNLIKLSRFLPDEKEKKREVVSAFKAALKKYPEYKRSLGLKKRLLYRVLLIKNGM